jgi:hypothetical protein
MILMRKSLVTVVEFPGFTRDALRTWTFDELDDFKAHLAANPEEGAVVSGTGGFRKVRWAVPGKGKRGGARVVYFYYDPGHPLLLAMFYAKADKANLTPAEKSELHAVASATKRGYRSGRQ